MTFPDWVTSNNFDVIAAFLLALVIVLLLEGIRDHFNAKARRDARHRAALRGDDPYAVEWNWRGGDGWRNR